MIPELLGLDTRIHKMRLPTVGSSVRRTRSILAASIAGTPAPVALQVPRHGSSKRDKDAQARDASFERTGGRGANIAQAGHIDRAGPFSVGAGVDAGARIASSCSRSPIARG